MLRLFEADSLIVCPSLFLPETNAKPDFVCPGKRVEEVGELDSLSMKWLPRSISTYLRLLLTAYQTFQQALISDPDSVQVDEYYSSQAGGLSIIGYYHANERYNDADLGSAAKKIADKIAQYVPQAAVILVRLLLDSQQKMPTK